MSHENLSIATVFKLGPIEFTSTVVTTWVIMAIVGLLAWMATRRLHTQPGTMQTALEGVVTAIEGTVAGVAPRQAQQIMPFIGSLWIFLVFANLAGLLPGAHSPTRDLSATAALACLVFLSTHWFAIRIQGFRASLHHYITPSPILLPFHLISEFTRTVALTLRLFGNIMSLEMAALLVLLVAGFLAPVPILMLHVVEALVQAYIFGMLALIYIGGGIQSQQRRQQQKKE